VFTYDFSSILIWDCSSLLMGLVSKLLARCLPAGDVWKSEWSLRVHMARCRQPGHRSIYLHIYIAPNCWFCLRRSSSFAKTKQKHNFLYWLRNFIYCCGHIFWLVSAIVSLAESVFESASSRCVFIVFTLDSIMLLVPGIGSCWKVFAISTLSAHTKHFGIGSRLVAQPHSHLHRV